LEAIPYRQAAIDKYDADYRDSAARGEGAKRIARRDKDDADIRFKSANEDMNKVDARTAHPFAGFGKSLGDEDLANFRNDYDSSLGKKRGGKVMKKAEGGSIRARFDAAFGEARKRGDKTFEFNGKTYGTQLVKSKPKVEVGPHGPGDESFTPDKAGSRMKNVAEENSMKESSSTKPDFVRKQYGMPGVRMGKQGEPAIKIGSDEPEKPTKSNYNYGVSRTKDEQELADMVQKKRGGSVAKPKLASDKKKYSDRDMQGIISQAKQLAPKIIQANQARAAQAQAAAGAQRPPLGGAMPARPPMGAAPAGAMPAMKKGGANWIKGAIKKPGALHKALHVPKGEKIPDEKLEKAMSSNNPMMAKRARLAKTLKSFRKG
jgi:hypothetical protein